MKKFLRRWLGVEGLSNDFHEEQLKQTAESIRRDKLIAELAIQFEELEREARLAFQIMNGLLKHLDVDFYRDFEPDPQFAPSKPRMREVIKIRPNKKRKL